MLERQEDGFPEVSPIDLSHLARQTLGDEGLKREVLHLFLVQATAARDELHMLDGEARRSLAHQLVGSARAVGAFPLAACAAELEASPYSAAADRLPRLVEEVQVFLTREMG
ncbi:Hpt domain-containing protein [Chelativorans sp.]|uniref:Hpt domain-containing protein n=1 Tax=Chelativorans sp. TaxID=2203393 RepID=UPI002810BAAA|nr:Hpt domain-containing protein [Chelativorans sp.]